MALEHLADRDELIAIFHADLALLAEWALARGDQRLAEGLADHSRVLGGPAARGEPVPVDIALLGRLERIVDAQERVFWARLMSVAFMADDHSWLGVLMELARGRTAS